MFRNLSCSSLTHRLLSIRPCSLTVSYLSGLADSPSPLYQASLGLKNEGWLDAYSLLQGFKARAQSLGVTYVSATVAGLTREASTGAVTGVTLNNGQTIRAQHVINASGEKLGLFCAVLCCAVLCCVVWLGCLFAIELDTDNTP
jgi:hypothetical protein